LHVQKLSPDVIRLSTTNILQLRIPDDLSECSIECDGITLGVVKDLNKQGLVIDNDIRKVSATSFQQNFSNTLIKFCNTTEQRAKCSRIADILKSEVPLSIVYDCNDSRTHSVALRLSRSLSLFFRIDSQLLSNKDYRNCPSLASSAPENLIVVAKGKTSLPDNAISSQHLELRDDGLKIHGRLYTQRSTGYPLS
jgi:hypothetical protein